MKVSVIVPIYNSVKYLPDCLDSLVNQTLDEIEIIAILDASFDGSLEILKDYEKRYPDKIKVYVNSHNLGPGATRNIGISIASGEYIGFLDSDDYVNFGMYKKMYDMAVKNNYPEIVTTGIVFVKDNKYLKDNFKESFNTKGRIINVLNNPLAILDKSPSVCNKIFRRDIVKNYPFVENRMWEDVAFSYAKMFRANRILSFNDADYFYRRNSEGVSAKSSKPNSNILDIFVIADTLEKELRKTNRFELFKDYIRFIQISYSLYRILEILAWDIDEELKENLCKIMNNLIIDKYGDWKDYPKELLSSKIGIIELDKLNEIRNLNKLKI